MTDRNQLLNDPETALRTAMEGHQASVWTAMPGIVQSVDLTAMTCKVQISIQGTVEMSDGTTKSVDYPPLINVPIVFPSAGGFIITLPLAQGDEVLVVFASRCIDSWWQSGGYNNRPMEARMHDLSDGFAIPGPRSQPNVVGGISSTGAQIRNDAGTTYVEIAGDGKIKLVSPSEVDITAPLTKVTGALTVTGALLAGTLGTTGGGGATIAGSMTVTGEVTASGIPLSTHHHPGVQTGGGNTGGPVP